MRESLKTTVQIVNLVKSVKVVAEVFLLIASGSTWDETAGPFEFDSGYHQEP